MAGNSRAPTGAAVSHNRYPTAPDGRGASTVTRKAPVGKDPLAVEEGKNDVAAQLEHLAASKRRA